MGQDYTHSVVDLDLQIRGGGGGHPDPEIRGGPVSKKIFSALRASSWSRNKGGRAPRAPPLDPQLPVLRPIGARTLPFREVHAFMAYYVKEYPGVSVGCQL